jgi:hypothetical protein
MDFMMQNFKISIFDLKLNFELRRSHLSSITILVLLRMFGKMQLKKQLIHPYILKISKCLQQNLKF